MMKATVNNEMVFLILSVHGKETRGSRVDSLDSNYRMLCVNRLCASDT